MKLKWRRHVGSQGTRIVAFAASSRQEESDIGIAIIVDPPKATIKDSLSVPI